MSRLPPRRGVRRLLGAQSGASTAEFAIVLPFFFLFLLAILEFARAFWTVNTLQYAVGQGARYVTMSPSGNTKPTVGGCATWTATAYQTSVQAYVQRQLATVLPSATVPMPVATPNCSASPPTVTVTVEASYNFDFILPNLATLLGTVPLRQQAIVTTPLI